MQLEAQQERALPQLAWCARIDAGSDRIVVRHGAAVETRADRCFEGAWDAPFAPGDFHVAPCFTGTGLVLAGRGVCFAASSSLADPLFVHRSPEALVVSNSPVFALVEAGDALDPAHAFHSGDALAAALAGTERRRRTIRSLRGRFERHEARNLYWDARRGLRMQRKPRPPAPRDFDDHVAELERRIAATLHNAADPKRRRRYRALAGVSRGYDCAALLALARKHGCQQAFTFADGEAEWSGDPQRAPDDGSAIARALGVTVVQRERGDYLSHEGLPEAEFAALAPGSDVVMASCADLLEDRILLSGRYGDDLWTRRRVATDGRLQQHSIGGLGGSSSTEFRLRTGFFHFAPLFSDAANARRIQRISSSPQLAAWSLGGRYDRPIPRRILEQAGVPREAFGLRKTGRAFRLLGHVDDLCPASRRDFLDFVAGLPAPRSSARRRAALLALHRAESEMLERLRWLAGRVGWRPALRPRATARWSRPLFETQLMLWGCARLRERYAPPSGG